MTRQRHLRKRKQRQLPPAEALRRHPELVRVDAWLIPREEAAAYRRRREAAALKAAQALMAFCARTERQGAGSQDGEAIWGLDAQNQLIAIIHLDPQGVETIEALDLPQLTAHLRQG